MAKYALSPSQTLASSSGAQQFQGSTQLDHAKLERFSWINSEDGNIRCWTVSYWKRKTKGGIHDWFGTYYSDSNRYSHLSWNTSNQLASKGGVWAGTSGTSELWSLVTTKKFRDLSGWYHVVLAYDCTQGTAADRMKLYVNGKRITEFATANYPAQNGVSYMNRGGSDWPVYLGGRGNTGAWGGNDDCYMSNAYFIDGAQLGAEYFGFTDPLTSNWVPKTFNGAGDHNQFNRKWSEIGTWTGWSTGNYAPKYMFNGVGRVSCYPGSTTFTAKDGATSSGGSAATWELGDHTIKGITSLRMFIWINGGQWAATDQVKINDVDVTTTVKAQSPTVQDTWNWVDFGSTFNELNKIEIKDYHRYIASIEVNGEILLDNGVGLNGWYLPMDGSADFTSADQSGQRNNANTTSSPGSHNSFRIGNRASMDQATDCFPILETSNSGGQSVVGIRTDPYFAHIHSAVSCSSENPNNWASRLVDYSNHINSAVTAKTVTTDNGGGDSSIRNAGLYGVTSWYDGSNDRVYWDGPGSLGTATPFTMECWFFIPAGQEGQNGRIFSCEEANYSNEHTQFRAWGGGYEAYIGDGSNWSAGGGKVTQGWHHGALCRDGTEGWFFIDGQMINYTATNANKNAIFTKLDIGWGYGSENFNGRVTDARFYNGVCKYKKNFKPAAFLYPDTFAESPVGYSGPFNFPQKPSEIGHGAVEFEGSGGDYLDLGTNSDLVLGANDFTLEGWVYYGENYDGYNGIIGNWASGDYGYILEVVGGSGNDYSELEFYYYDTSNNFVGPIQGGNLIRNQWHHFAVVRNATTISMYVDGLRYGSGSTINVGIRAGNSTYTLGGQVGGGNGYWTGMMSNVRVTVGQALYNGSQFNVPTEPLTLTSQGATASNVKLLCCNSPTEVTSFTKASITPTIIGSLSPTYTNPFSKDVGGTVNRQFQPPITTYATWDDNFRNSIQSGGGERLTLSDGGLACKGGGDYFKTITASIPVNADLGGQFYFECTSAGGSYWQVGIVREDSTHEIGKDGWGISGATWGIAYQTGGSSNNASYARNKGNLASGVRSARDYGDIVGACIDFKNKKFYVTINGARTDQFADLTSAIEPGDDSTWGRSALWYPAISLGDWSSMPSGMDDTSYCNFGQQPFRFTPPEGFKPICAATVLPNPEVVNAEEYVKAVTWTGKGDSTIETLDLKFKPDLIWIKDRSAATNHAWYDTTRGNTNALRCNSVAVQSQYGSATVTPFANGFEVNPGGNGGGLTFSGNGMVAWCFRAGGSEKTFNVDGRGYDTAAETPGLSGSGLTILGASIGKRQGFSIIQYQGSSAAGNHSFKHGLGQRPDFVIIKAMDWDASSGGWPCWHITHENKAFFIDRDVAADGTYFNQFWNAAPSATDVTVRADTGVSTGNRYRTTGRDNPYMAYLWSNTPGFFHAGHYQGTGNNSGPLQLLGFRPAIVMLKEFDNDSTNWLIYDNQRESANPTIKHLFPNKNDGGGTYDGSNTDLSIDFYATGFKIRNSNSGVNANNDRYCYCAWAESPFSSTYGSTANAR